MNVIFLIWVLLSIILEPHFCLNKNETCTPESSTTTETSEPCVTVTEKKTCTSESSSTTETPEISQVTVTENETCTSESSTTAKTSESSVTETEKKTCNSESSSTTETPAEDESNEASVLEGCTFYFNETGHLICCSLCRPDHVDDFPRVEFDLAGGINKLKKKFRRCCCLMTRRQKCTTTEKPKPKGPPKSCGQIIKTALSKVVEEINKPLYVPSVCRCICHKYAI